MVAALDRRLTCSTPLVSVLLYVMFLILTGLVVKSLQELPRDREPRPVSVPELIAGRIPAGSFVTVDGLLDERQGFTLRTTRRTVGGRFRGRAVTQEERLEVLSDTRGSVGILVTDPNLTAGGRVQLTGMVRPVPSGARETLQRENAAGSSRVHADVMLRTNQTPISRVWLLLSILLCPVAIGATLFVRFKRHTIFRAGENVEAPSVPGFEQSEPIDLRVSALFSLAGGRPRRFVEMPCQALMTERGEVILGANVDASQWLFGQQITRRVGFWTVVIPVGGLARVTRGEIAYGSDVRPAAKLEVDGPPRRQVTLSFATVEQREQFVRALEHRCAPRRRTAA
jgi:hypothetical protein